jgi:UDP-glucose 4-epimerase
MDDVLITGGAGFIGSNIVALLLAKGYKVRVLDDLSTGYLENLKGLDIEFIQGDIRDKQCVKRALTGVKTVYHLAAHIGNVKSIKYPYVDLDINVNGTITLLEAAKEMGVANVVYSSSAAIYGELKSYLVNEDHPLEPISPYGVSKLAAEKYVLAYGALYGIRTVALRYFNVYGVHQRYDSYGNVIPIFMNRIYEKDKLTVYGDGKQTRDFVNVKDVALANYLAGENSQVSGFFNVGSGYSITINNLVDLLIKKTDYKVNVEYAAPRKGEVLHCTSDISKIVDKLNFKPSVKFEEGLNEYYDWFINQQKNY